MQNFDIPAYRLNTHHLLNRKFLSAADTVAHFGAVQAQDYFFALWAVGLRTENATEAYLEQAIADRAIVRTWPLRSTIHFVAAADARWMVELSAGRVIKAATNRLRRLELDEDTFRRSHAVIAGVLRDSRPVMRRTIYEALNAAGISTAGERGYHIMWYHAHDGLICIGPREGKQQTFVLTDAWLPATNSLLRDEALAELARRYFTGHSPASLKDFVWWTGLSPAEAQAGLDAVRSQLARETIDGETYWIDPNQPATDVPQPTAHLLPYVDEYLVGYQDRTAVQPVEYNALVESGNLIFHAPILIDGRVAGIWTRKLRKRTVGISATTFRALTTDERNAFQSAVEQYGEFLGVSAELALTEIE